MIIVGSANSSNSVRLKEVAKEYGATRAERVDYASQVDESWFEGVATVGLSSGASVPEVLVQDVLALLADYGYGQVDEVVTAEEDIMFSLPKELRAQLKRVGDAGACGRRPEPALARPRRGSHGSSRRRRPCGHDRRGQRGPQRVRP